MKYTRLGRTGLSVSRLCLGTMTFGLQCDEATSRAILDRAFAGGITFLDTSDVYPLGGTLETVGRTEEIIGRWLGARRRDVVFATKVFGATSARPWGRGLSLKQLIEGVGGSLSCLGTVGRTEEIIGRWLGARRRDVVIATKVFGATSARPWDRGLSRKHILDAIDASLRRLGTDYVDLYQAHHPDASAPIDETLRAFDDIVRAGKARYVGCSNFPAWQTARALGRSELLGLARFDCVQPRYNLLFRQPERDLLPLCLEEGVGVIPYNPLAGGFLTGKHHKDAGPAPGTRFTLASAAARYRE